MSRSVCIARSVFVVGLAVFAAGCSSEDAPSSDARSTQPGTASLRLAQIADEVDAWAASDTLEGARAHAEAAANLVVGPGGLGHGDRDGDDVIGGQSPSGFLPGPEGSPPGLVLEEHGEADCVLRDVLGGGWDDPVARWQLLASAIGEWTPTKNTFPSLPSHPMRIVGWATLSQTATYEEAIEYSGHADLHVDVSRDALADC